MGLRTAGSKSARIFVRTTDKEDGAYCGSQVGLITVDSDDNYRISYLEAGFRSDHITDPIMNRWGMGATPVSIHNPNEYDADIMEDLPSIKKARKKAKKAAKTAAEA